MPWQSASAVRIIESDDVAPAPLRMMLGSQALESTLTRLRMQITGFEEQTKLAASKYFPSNHSPGGNYVSNITKGYIVSRRWDHLTCLVMECSYPKNKG